VTVAGTGLVVRAPNHLGDLVMSLPALQQGQAQALLVRRPLLPILELAGLPSELIPLDRGLAAAWTAARAIHELRCERGVLLPPSFSSALILVAAGIPERRGTATDFRSSLLTDAVPAAVSAGQHRASLYVELVTGRRPAGPPTPRLAISDDQRAAFACHVPGVGDSVIGVFPGSFASSRRWSPARFRELVALLGREGHSVVVFGGPAERELTAEVAGDAAIDLGGRTDLPLLAAGLASCRLLVTNDSGPMHLAAAVGTPVVALFGAGDPSETGPLGPGHHIVRHAELPCIACRKNACPRRGHGNFLPHAERECLELITAGEVMGPVRAVLSH
jgi:heptosyltransferase II